MIRELLARFGYVPADYVPAPVVVQPAANIIKIIVGHYVYKDHDTVQKREFVTMPHMKTIEKDLLNRIQDRMESMADPKCSVPERDALSAKIEELKDIIIEWNNLREDLSEEDDGTDA